jgi:hypothetical protein
LTRVIFSKYFRSASCRWAISDLKSLSTHYRLALCSFAIWSWFSISLYLTMLMVFCYRLYRSLSWSLALAFHLLR